MTAALFSLLQRHPRELRGLPLPRDDDDVTLALYVLYELHYRGFSGVDEAWEWEPSLLRLRAALERRFERDLCAAVGPVDHNIGDVAGALLDCTSWPGPSLSRWCFDHATLHEMREFAIHRSAYQLKEADAHTWAIPRLSGRPKAALVEIQRGEYGDGRVEAMHAELFADTMRALDLDAAYGTYLDRIPAVTLTTVNLMSMFGLHRRWRGALVGHLALFEMTSQIPMGRYAATLRRLDRPEATAFYDAHVEADAHHSVVALRDMAVALAVDEPQLAPDIVFGAYTLAHVEREFTRHCIDAWNASRSSLRRC